MVYRTGKSPFFNHYRNQGLEQSNKRFSIKKGKVWWRTGFLYMVLNVFPEANIFVSRKRTVTTSRKTGQSLDGMIEIHITWDADENTELCWCPEEDVICLVGIWPRMNNRHLIMKNCKTNSEWIKFYEITSLYFLKETWMLCQAKNGWELLS